MLNEMIKNAGCTLGERVKVAAAIVAMHNYDRTQDILETAGEIQKNAAYNGVRLSDNQAVAASENAYSELDQEKLAYRYEMVKQAGLAEFFKRPGGKALTGGLLGAGVGAGGAALAGEDDAKVLALAGLLGGGAGAYLNAQPGVWKGMGKGIWGGIKGTGKGIAGGAKGVARGTNAAAKFLTQTPGGRIGGGALLGAGAGYGLGRLSGEDDNKALLLESLLGAGAGAALGGYGPDLLKRLKGKPVG